MKVGKGKRCLLTSCGRWWLLHYKCVFDLHVPCEHHCTPTTVLELWVYRAAVWRRYLWLKLQHRLCLQIRVQGGQMDRWPVLSEEKFVSCYCLKHYLHFHPFLMQATCQHVNWNKGRDNKLQANTGPLDFKTLEHTMISMKQLYTSLFTEQNLTGVEQKSVWLKPPYPPSGLQTSRVWKDEKCS